MDEIIKEIEKDVDALINKYLLVRKESIRTDDDRILVFSNKYVQIHYLGIVQSNNNLHMKLLIKALTHENISIGIKQLYIDDVVIDIFPYIAMNCKQEEVIEKDLIIGYNNLIQVGKEDIRLIDKIEIQLFCELDSGKIFESNLIRLPYTSYINKIFREMNNLIKSINDGMFWNEGEKNIPEFIKFTLPIPKSKQDQIDYYLLENYIRNRNTSTYEIEFDVPTSNLHIIELVGVFHYIQFENKFRENYKDLFTELRPISNLIQLYDSLQTLQREISQKEIKNNKIGDQTYKTIHDHYYRLKNERDIIYGDLIYNKKIDYRWVSEQQLYIFVRDIYPDARFQYRTEWLKQYSLDIYVPSLKVGIEYQGLQHYQSIDYFGGYDDFLHRQENDIQKERICEEHHVNLIKWEYNLAVTKENVLNKLKTFKSQSEF